MVNQPIQNNGVLYPNFLDEVSDDEYFRSIPVGFRFKPTHDELIVDYLMKKIKNEKLPRNNITLVNIYEFNPEILVGADNIVKRNGENVGCRKSLVFYEGKPSNGAKTSWIMHEYTVNNPPILQKSSSDDMRVNLSIYTSSLHVFRVEALMSCLVYNISSVYIYNVVQIVSCSWTIWFCVESKTTRKVTKIESEKRDDQTEETNSNTNEGANYEESKRREGENTINVAAREDHFWSFDNIDLAIADSFLGNGENMMGDVNDYNPYGVFNYQNTQYTHIDSIPLHDNNQAPMSIVPPNYSMEPYIYGQYPVGYMPDVTGQHQELPGFPKMDNIGGLLGSVAGGHALAPTT
ncbi:NAC domain-containing protein [Abeliophyllum distichum]|uniref:NAC domain-containing protein n=1 Tax=Abeliophyllum distichum TaxID=126358 RepID=A0ABD1VBM4_9LAMI